MAAKKSSQSKQPTPAQLAALKKTKVGSIKPDTAITKMGQPAKGLANPRGTDRYSTTAKTPISKGAFAGSGNPKGKMFNITKGNVVNAALTATALPGSGTFTKWAAGKVAGKVAGPVGDATWNVAAKGISTMRGGGRLYNASTPFGKTLASTKIMNAGQKGAAMTGLETRAANIANTAERAAAGAAARVTKEVIRKATGGAKAVGVTGAVVNAKKNNKKKK